MSALSAFLLRKATGRTLFKVLGLLILCILGFNLVLTPLYQEVAAGFVPFDLQERLTHEMIAIQLGAMSPLAARAYVYFSALDFVYPLVSAAFMLLLWAWLVAKSGSAWMMGAFDRGWWLWALFPAVWDLAENVAFLRILLIHPVIEPDVIEGAVLAHRAKGTFMTIAQFITVGLIAATVLARLRRRD